MLIGPAMHVCRHNRLGSTPPRASPRSSSRSSRLWSPGGTSACRTSCSRPERRFTPRSRCSSSSTPTPGAWCSTRPWLSANPLGTLWWRYMRPSRRRCRETAARPRRRSARWSSSRAHRPPDLRLHQERRGRRAHLVRGSRWWSEESWGKAHPRAGEADPVAQARLRRCSVTRRMAANAAVDQDPTGISSPPRTSRPSALAPSSPSSSPSAALWSQQSGFRLRRWPSERSAQPLTAPGACCWRVGAWLYS
jgi:hypothetical protein